MRILVIHDRESASDEIHRIVEAACMVPATVDVADDGRNGRKALETGLYDLIILDLTIPFIKGRSPIDYRAAADILDEIFYLGTFSPPGDIVGITREPDALKIIGSSVGKHLMAIIQEDDGELWKQQLSDKIAYCELVSSKRQASMIGHYDYDVLVLTALDKEALPYRSLVELADLPTYPGAKEFTLRDAKGSHRRGVLFSIGKSGQASAASAAQSLISYFRPRLAVMSGFCGGVEGKVKKGDVLFFDSAYDWDYGKWYTIKSDEGSATGHGGTAARFYARPTPVFARGDNTDRVIRDYLLEGPQAKSHFDLRVKDVSSGERDSIEVDFAAAASGSAVVGSLNIVDQIRSISDGIKAIDMESYGFYHACENTHVIKPACFCVKAVADFADGTKDDRYHSICSEFAASVTLELIRGHWTF